ncbi:MarR family winged helix-turn-helix transcriptional regulator [Actinomadura latina]|uniref:MarR family transcriptional regulator n=1 Tax=Actinomadura latina TaxID=163603 RepID=A0A846Z9R0_9ACTN|nr:MarR family transcriptional regulator [Actinomadura latina]NKZ07484.1 MarR family transcriptional regulator [Actinomadura latina]
MSQRRPRPSGSEPADDGTGGVPEDVTVAVERVLSTTALLWSRSEQGLEPAVSPIQLRAVEAISRFGRLNLGGLAEELGAIPSSTSRLCDRLEAAGLIVREPARADRREIIVRLTDQGEELYAQLVRRRRAAVRDVLAQMSPGSRARLIDALTEFGQACERRAPGGPQAVGSRTA